MAPTNVEVWRPTDTIPPAPETPGSEIFRPDILNVIEKKIEGISKELNDLSLDIHAHPELKFEEHRTHDVLTKFMEQQGFEVKTHYQNLPTAWLATYKHGQGGRTIGVNSEMDALPSIGHACGHNLIGTAGVAIALSMKEVLERFNISGTIQLLGTPAEEGGGGKLILLEKGAYKDMAACLMQVLSMLLKKYLTSEKGVILPLVQRDHAHAALSPWEGRNALDAAVLAYTNVSALRQQLRPSVRVHGIFSGEDWAVNVIPDNAKYSCFIRTTTAAELEEVVQRVTPCFSAAAEATGCQYKITRVMKSGDIRQNKALGDEVARVVRSRYGGIDYEWGIHSASTDFGDVTYALPSLHPGFAIPTVENGGNHTHAFAASAAGIQAHNACMDVSKALAHAGIRVLIDDEFYAEVKRTFEANEPVKP
ncbi:hypothetical protein D9757_000839 [Collybiopsis confluens]|uniref:Peptidase M20 domain-containing protein 2 n=1 Tax=Collybiopsis confluens TaxID=2823264 RepID=A0A8H5I0H9_9AGAR|nr:hypothetical protein D9757_000839 [Collybiopsis confluens]